MSRHINKEALVAAVKASQELSDDQKADIIELIRKQKKYGLVWENSSELAEQELKNKIPILKEDTSKRILNDANNERYPNHVIIEADNLHALIALSYTHAGKIDVMYFLGQRVDDRSIFVVILCNNCNIIKEFCRQIVRLIYNNSFCSSHYF